MDRHIYYVRREQWLDSSLRVAWSRVHGRAAAQREADGWAALGWVPQVLPFSVRARIAYRVWQAEAGVEQDPEV